MCTIETRKRWINSRRADEIDSAINVYVYTILDVFSLLSDCRARAHARVLISDWGGGGREWLLYSYQNVALCRVLYVHHHENAFKTRLSFHNSQTHSQSRAIYFFFLFLPSMAATLCCYFAILCTCQLRIIPSNRFSNQCLLWKTAHILSYLV